MFAYMIREAIKRRMKELNITQVRIIEDLGLNKGNFSSFLKGNRSLPLDDIEKVCEYIGLELKPKERSSE